MRDSDNQLGQLAVSRACARLDGGLLCPLALTDHKGLLRKLHIWIVATKADRTDWNHRDRYGSHVRKCGCFLQVSKKNSIMKPTRGRSLTVYAS